MPFSQKVAEDLLVQAARCCCLSDNIKGQKSKFIISFRKRMEEVTNPKMESRSVLIVMRKLNHTIRNILV